MVDENQNIDKEWEELSDLVAERDDIVKPDNGKEEVDEGHTTLKQRQIETPRLTDAQVFDNRMFPNFERPWMNRLMSSEIFPDSYNHLFRICVKGLMKDDKSLPLHQAIFDSNTACSIALGREGRFDQLAHDGTVSQKDEDKDKL